VLVGNALVVSALWFLLPSSVKDWLFSLRGPLAFAAVLEAWMLADTPATNMLGNDAISALAAVEDPTRLRRLLRVKVVALACLVGPPSVVVTALIAADKRDYGGGAMLCCLLLAAPLGVCAISAWLGIVLPYHRRSLQWRWAHRRPWRRTARWILLSMAPYVLVPVVGTILVGPPIVLGLAIGGREPTGHLTTASMLLAVVLGCLVCATAFALGPGLSSRIAMWRRDHIVTHLADPERG
jgi:hypothetical protein